MKKVSVAVFLCCLVVLLTPSFVFAQEGTILARVEVHWGYVVDESPISSVFLSSSRDKLWVSTKSVGGEEGASSYVDIITGEITPLNFNADPSNGFALGEIAVAIEEKTAPFFKSSWLGVCSNLDFVAVLKSGTVETRLTNLSPLPLLWSGDKGITWEELSSGGTKEFYKDKSSLEILYPNQETIGWDPCATLAWNRASFDFSAVGLSSFTARNLTFLERLRLLFVH
ncbi:MAG: hypothetical protein ABIJ36_01050 [Patescibacteria group bacterium]|nr:hypothetical protein [Patescibacteria group bacterium]